MQRTVIFFFPKQDASLTIAELVTTGHKDRGWAGGASGQGHKAPSALKEGFQFCWGQSALACLCSDLSPWERTQPRGVRKSSPLWSAGVLLGVSGQHCVPRPASCHSGQPL